MAEDVTTLLLPSWQIDSRYSTIRIGPIEFGPRTGVVAHVKEVDSDLLVDHKKGSGVDGGNKVLRGLEQRKFDVEIEIWDAVGEALWEQAVPILLPLKDAQKRVVWPVVHPALQRHGLTKAVVKRCGEREPDAKGVLIGKLQLWEDRVRGHATHKPTAQPDVPAISLQTPRVQVPFLPGVVPPSKKVQP